MSGTDKTRPWPVRATDPLDVDAVLLVVHDHRDGCCDLPGEVAGEDFDPARAADGRCYAWLGVAGVDVVGCPHCLDAPGRRAAERSRRREVRTALTFAARGGDEHEWEDEVFATNRWRARRWAL